MQKNAKSFCVKIKMANLAQFIKFKIMENQIIVNKIKLSGLKSRIMTEIVKGWNHRKNVGMNTGKFDIMVDTGESWVFGMTGSINADFDELGNFQIYECCVTEAYFQFPDFEADLKGRYISQIEKFITE